jgi:hypothetical protein
VLFLLKYWRYIALVLAIIAVFTWHKLECSKAYDEGVKDERAAVEKKTEQLRVTMQAKIDEAEAKSAETITIFKDRVKVVDREVIRKEKVFIDSCPATFVDFNGLRNKYITTTDPRYTP